MFEAKCKQKYDKVSSVYSVILPFDYIVQISLHVADLELPTVTMNRYPLEEAPCFERILDHKLKSVLKWSSYIRPIAKKAGKRIGFFYRSSKYVLSHVILYLYNLIMSLYNFLRGCQ